MTLPPNTPGRLSGHGPDPGAREALRAHAALYCAREDKMRPMPFAAPVRAIPQGGKAAAQALRDSLKVRPPAADIVPLVREGRPVSRLADARAAARLSAGAGDDGAQDTPAPTGTPVSATVIPLPVAPRATPDAVALHLDARVHVPAGAAVVPFRAGSGVLTAPAPVVTDAATALSHDRSVWRARPTVVRAVAGVPMSVPEEALVRVDPDDLPVPAAPAARRRGLSALMAVGLAGGLGIGTVLLLLILR